MSPHASHSPSAYSQSYPTAAENTLRNVPQISHETVNLNGYVMSDSRQPHVHSSRRGSQPQHPQNQASGLSIASYPEFSLPYQNSSRDHIQSYDGALDGRLDSPQDVKGTFSHRLRGSFSEISGGRVSIASARDQRPSISSVGNAGYPQRNGSIDESDTTSPTSSRGFGMQGSDDSIPQSINHATGTGNNRDSRHKDGTEHPPPWSELKTKAGKERKRLPLACIACRRKKIRCSGEKPACKHCLRSRIPCVYKVTTRKAAPRTDYMAMLDKRLKRMEERVIKIIPREDAGKLPNIGRANVKPPPPSQAAKSNGPKKRAADEAFGTELDDWAYASTHNPPGLTSRPWKGVDHDEHQLLTEGAESLPPKEMQEHLAEVFFDCLYGQSYHVLHKPSFMRRLRAGKVPPVLILAVCAISARFSTHPQVSTEPAFLRGEAWAKPARDIVLRRYDEPNITILTVLLILGLHEFGTCQGGRSWMLGGMAMRMAYALQLHRELDHDPLGRKHDKSTELSFTDREIRRRTMWACFLMDRFNSSGTERPPFANEENIKVQLPIKESHFQMEIPGPTESLDGKVPNPVSPDAGQVSDPKENMGVAAYMIRVIALWGRVIKYLNLGGKQEDLYPLWHAKSQYAVLRKQAEDFKKALPEELQYTSANLNNHAAEKLANQFLFMHISYSQIVLFLHRVAIPATPGGRLPKDMPKEFVNEAGHTAVEAASQISSLLREASEHLVAAPFAGYCAFVSSTVHLWGMFSKSKELKESSKRNLEYNVKYLSKMKKHWGMFHYMSENLKDIYRQYADALNKGPNLNVSSKSDTSIFQYGDWFNKYPHGVSKTDYEEAALDIKRESGNDAVLSQKSDLQSVEEFFNNLSPPARTEHQKKATKRHGRGSTHLQQHPQPFERNVKVEQHVPQLQLQQQPPMLNMAHQHQQPQQQPLNPTSYAQDLYTPTHPSFPPNTFAQNLMPIHHQGLLLPELDRQLVFGAYAGTEPTATNTSSTLDHLSNNNNTDNHNGSSDGLWDGNMDFSQALNGSGTYSDMATSAWFMPFNLNPPDIVGEGDFGSMGPMGGYGIDLGIDDVSGGVVDGQSQGMDGLGGVRG